MVRFNWRKWNRVLHRDLGYFFVGMTLIYALSGLALNHIDDWNPSYQVTLRDVQWEDAPVDSVTRADVLAFLERYDVRDRYKKYYYPEPQQLRIFLKSGNVDVDLATGQGRMELLSRRPVFYQVNFLHYNPGRLWTWFSDIFGVGLMLIAITGLFILKGKKGITGRGAWLTTAGILVPLGLLLMYL
jgi:hypothetical protein